MQTTTSGSHYSFSGLNRFATCPLSFKLHYLDELPAETGEPPKFGTVLHRTNESLLREHVRGNRVGRIAVDDATRAFRREWAASELRDHAMFTEGLAITKAWALRQGEIDYRDVLGIEQEFDLRIGPHRIIGAIDRVDRVGDDTVRVRDYKSNRLLFTPDEVDTSLQLSIYDLAARQLWPWAKHVELEFDMLRHNVVLKTSRTDAQREATRQYMQATIAQIESATQFEARPNTNCVHCDHRNQCPAYAEALEGKQYVVALEGDDIEIVAHERAEVARLVKILSDRKETLDGVIKAHLANAPELVAGRSRYAMSMTARTEYPFDGVVDVLVNEARVPREWVVQKIAEVNTTALKECVDAAVAGMPKEQATLIRAMIDAKAKRTYSPRLLVREVKS